jgi:hypothetical protein
VLRLKTPKSCDYTVDATLFHFIEQKKCDLWGGNDSCPVMRARLVKTGFLFII